MYVRLAGMPRPGRRRTAVIIVLGLGLIVFLSLQTHSFLIDNSKPLVGGHLTTRRPNHAMLIRAEKALPQHNLSLPYPEGKHGRYVKFTNQIRGLGWNNVLNELYSYPSACLCPGVSNAFAVYYAATSRGVRNARMCFKTIFGK